MRTFVEFYERRTTMSNPIICTSEWLRKSKETAEVAKAIAAALEKLHVEHRELRHTNDYWCRDYMPVRLSDSGTYARYTYSPDYLVEDKKMLPYITEQGEACRELNLFAPADMDIVFDGGNFVRCGNKVIMTDKIFSENPKWLVHKLIRRLRGALCADIVLLPWDMEDPYGHADGMVADLGENRILLNGCWKHNVPQFHNRLRKILDAHFEVVELSFDCKEDKDSWCYLNYLQVPGGILLPCLSEHIDCENDIAAVETFERLFPDLEIIPIYAKPLIRKGGAIHCVTWEFYERNNLCNQ